MHSFCIRGNIVQSFRFWGNIVHSFRFWGNIVHSFRFWGHIVHSFHTWLNFVLDISDFALNQWLRVRSETADDILPEYYIAEFLQELDLTSYLLDTPCSRNDVPYVNATDGWNNGKKSQNK